MDIKDKHLALINELYRSFDFFNQHFCKGELKRPIITIQKGKKNVLGWYGNNFWNEVGNKENQFDELNLVADTLHRSPSEVLQTLLHEMAHLKNWQNNIKDCNELQYHNKHFKIAAEHFGLTVGRMKNRGWAHTSLSDASLTAIELLKPDLKVYSIVRKPQLKVKKPQTFINLSASLDYQTKIDKLTSEYGSKREMVEAAIDLLYKS